MNLVFSKKDAEQALDRLVKFFQSYKGEYFGLDDLGIIDLYIHQVKEI